MLSKTVNGVNTEYIYNGEILAGQKTGNDIIVFMYDNNSDAFGFIYNSTEYYYIKNAQNDVTAIADSNGNVLARYYYDAWGKVLEITGNTEIASLNPIRYRSYYYDAETGWYYLNTRYYSADMCRFINADGYIQTGQGVLDKNMFAYCANNPINRFDDNGLSWKTVKSRIYRVRRLINSFIRRIYSKKASVSYSYSSEKYGTDVVYIKKSKSITHTNKKRKTPITSERNIDMSNIWLGSSRGISVNASKASITFSSTPIGKEWSISIATADNCSFSFGASGSLTTISYNWSTSYTDENDTYSTDYSLNFNTFAVFFAIVGIYYYEAYSPSAPYSYGTPPIPQPALP